jgi:hypothetical protein
VSIGVSTFLVVSVEWNSSTKSSAKSSILYLVIRHSPCGRTGCVARSAAIDAAWIARRVERLHYPTLVIPYLHRTIVLVNPRLNRQVIRQRAFFAGKTSLAGQARSGGGSRRAGVRRRLERHALWWQRLCSRRLMPDVPSGGSAPFE